MTTILDDAKELRDLARALTIAGNLYRYEAGEIIERIFCSGGERRFIDLIQLLANANHEQERPITAQIRTLLRETAEEMGAEEAGR